MDGHLCAFWMNLLFFCFPEVVYSKCLSGIWALGTCILMGTFHRVIFGYYTVGLIIVYLNFATHGDEYCLT